MRYHFISTKMAIKKDNNNVGEQVEKLEPSYTGGKIIKWHFSL